MEFIKTPKVENVRLVEQNTRNSIEGTLYLTASHLIFIDTFKNETWLVHTHIHSIDKPSMVQGGCALKLRCKTFQVLVFFISQERDCHDLYSSLLKLSKPETVEDLYAFSFNPRSTQLQQQEGWDLFTLNNHFLQMGLPTRYWKISRINNEFGLCETYPKVLCVPSLATPALMMGSAAFRSKRRLPVLSYLHKNGAVIVRCSQPMAGLNSRSIEDEAYVDLIRRSKAGNQDFMYIVDTRPMINAVANRAQGKGYENTDFYENIKYLFLGIDNIHVMRTSLNKLLEACEDTSCTMSNWLEAVNSSGWLRHVHNVLQVSRFIAQAVEVEGRSVLVHCSDGWDRTAQTCALASIMLNSHYRTIDGFLGIVQKEWLHFGHKFTDRCGHIDGDSREMSPVFTQFIDAVWQLMRLYPSAFQFNETLLFDLHDHVFSCQFGTFLGNCAKERQEYSLPARTYSLWGWMMKRHESYTNPLYKANVEQQESLFPPTTPHFVRFWVKMYNRHNKGLLPRQDISPSVTNFNSTTEGLKNKVMELKRQKQQLQVKLGIQPDNQHVALTKANSNSLIELDHQSAVEFDVRPSSYPDLKQLAKPTKSEDHQLTNSTNDCTSVTNDHESAPNVHNTTTNDIEPTTNDIEPATTNDNAATNDNKQTTNEYNPISNDKQFANPSSNDHGSSTNDNKQVEMDNNSSEVGNELTVVFTTEKSLNEPLEHSFDDLTIETQVLSDEAIETQVG